MRRGITLQQFIKGASTLQEALELFSKSNLEPPPHSEIELALKTLRSSKVTAKLDAPVEKTVEVEVVEQLPEIKETPKKKGKKKPQQQTEVAAEETAEPMAENEVDVAVELQEQESVESPEFLLTVVSEDEQTE